MIIVRVLAFCLLFAGSMVGMGYLLHELPSLNTQAFNLSGFAPHWSTLLWGAVLCFCGWVAYEIK